MSKGKKAEVAVSIFVSCEESTYELLCRAREALRDSGIHNTWKKLAKELATSSEDPFLITKRYVGVVNG